MGIPAVLYDREKQIIYQEKDDGTKTEVGRRIRNTRGVIVSEFQKNPKIVIFTGLNGSGKGI